MANSIVEHITETEIYPAFEKWQKAHHGYMREFYIQQLKIFVNRTPSSPAEAAAFSEIMRGLAENI